MNENTDNKARLIEVADKWFSDTAAKAWPEADIGNLADRIEAAGLLAGSVGVDELKVSLWHEWTDGDWEHLWVKVESHLATITRSPEPKGRWISEEHWKLIIETLNDFAVTEPRGGGGDPEDTYTIEQCLDDVNDSSQDLLDKLQHLTPQGGS